MAQVTKRGRELWEGLGKPCGDSIVTLAHIGEQRCLENCSLIARHAVTLHHYAEAACNRELSKAEERKVELLEARVRVLVAQLGEGFRVRFNGDPRGFAVKIQNPAGRYNTWGGAEDGWGV